MEVELDLWEAYWLIDTSYHPDNISSTLKGIDLKSFSNIKVCLRILGTSFVTICTCEQSFSFMSRLKTYTCSTMILETLHGIELMYVHQKIVPETENVIYPFALTNRRISLYNYWTYFNGVGTNVSCQLKLTDLHIFVSLLIMDINKCQVRWNSASIQICFYYLLQVFLCKCKVLGFFFQVHSWQSITNKNFNDIMRFIIFSGKVFFSYVTLTYLWYICTVFNFIMFH